MIIGWRRLGAISVAAFGLASVGCDSGAPSKTRDEIAADSALASDLALANRDTLLVDSIGEYRPADAAERDTTGSGDLVTVAIPDQSKTGGVIVAPPSGKKTVPVQTPATCPAASITVMLCAPSPCMWKLCFFVALGVVLCLPSSSQ